MGTIATRTDTTYGTTTTNGKDISLIINTKLTRIIFRWMHYRLKH
jgi:hypothetical protein